MELYFTTLYKRENIDPLFARKILFENLLENPKYGRDKAVTLEYIDNESKMNNITGGNQMFPGSIHTFLYMSKKLLTNEDSTVEHEFVDVAPLFWFLGNKRSGKKLYVTGINFNLLHPLKRCFLLDVMYNADKDYFENFYSRNQLGAKGLMRINFETLWPLLKRANIAPVVYDIQYIKRLRLVEPTEYKYIPFLDFTESVRGLNLHKLQLDNLGLIDKSDEL